MQFAQQPDDAQPDVSLDGLPDGHLDTGLLTK
jgi:hypothetical protein